MKFGLLADRELGDELASAFDDVWIDRIEGPEWALVTEREEVERVAEQGLGLVAEPFAVAEDAGVWCDSYESVLASGRLKPVNKTVNATFAVKLPVEGNAEAGDLVGVVERYRQAGVDEVVFVLLGESAEKTARLIVDGVLGEFDDEEVKAGAEAKAARLRPAIEAALAGPASSGKSRKPRRKIGKRLADGGQNAVKRMSDRQIELLIGSRPGIRVFFRSMASMYRPAKSGGFRGEIEYTLSTPHGPETWTITCGETKATAKRGASDDAKLHVSAGIVDFIRVGTGDMSAPAALMSGKLEVKGDFALAVRMGEMFGGPKVL